MTRRAGPPRVIRKGIPLAMERCRKIWGAKSGSRVLSMMVDGGMGRIGHDHGQTGIVWGFSNHLSKNTWYTSPSRTGAARGEERSGLVMILVIMLTDTGITMLQPCIPSLSSPITRWVCCFRIQWAKFPIPASGAPPRSSPSPSAMPTSMISSDCNAPNSIAESMVAPMPPSTS